MHSYQFSLTYKGTGHTTFVKCYTYNVLQNTEDIRSSAATNNRLTLISIYVKLTKIQNALQFW